MSVTGERQESGEPPRKRVRKGTKSCWECEIILPYGFGDFSENVQANVVKFGVN